jgi:hypothetical protein
MGVRPRGMFRLLLGLTAATLLAGAEDPGGMPVRRVVLYKNGVGYFEHVGKVTGKQDVAIPFTSGQLNDVLKSLTVLDLDGGRITGVEYGSAAPVERQVGDLRLPFGEKTSLTEYLGALRGARLEVRSGTSTITGRLLSVERKTRMGGGTTLEVDYVSLITDNGELRTTEVSPQFSVKLLDRGLAGRLERFLDLVAAGREADVRRMVISTEGTGERSLYISYISEVPVWKSTYRIVLDAKHGRGPLLQGWAIVDNVVGQDWENVQLSLVAGAPQSFVQQLSQPYYSRRPVIGLPESVNLAPQTHQATLIPGQVLLAGKVTDPAGAAVAGAKLRAFDTNGGEVGEATADAEGVYGFGALPEGTVRVQVDAPGFGRVNIGGVQIASGRTAQQDVRMQVGAVAQTVEVMADSAVLQTSNSSVSGTVASGRMLGRGAGLGGVRAKLPPPAGGGSVASGVAGAIGGGSYRATAAQELGDLFEYKLKDPITILKNRSAMVPTVQSAITAEKVSLWNERRGMARPERVLWLTNSTGVTLDGGSFSVLEEDTFAGEGLFEAIRPAEKRLVSYASDLALVASSKIGSEEERVTRVRVSRGVMTQEHEVRERKTYTLRNEDTSGRTVIIEHPVRAGYDLRGDVKPAETTSDWMRFRVQVPSKQTVAFVVEEARPVQNAYQIASVGEDEVALFVRQRSIDKQLEDALRKIIAQKGVVSELDDQKTEREEESQTIFDDQQRLRENMKALKGSAEEKALLQRYTQQLNAQEGRLETLRKEMAQIEARRDAAQAEWNRMVQALAFDIRL